VSAFIICPNWLLFFTTYSIKASFDNIDSRSRRNRWRKTASDSCNSLKEGTSLLDRLELCMLLQDRVHLLLAQQCLLPLDPKQQDHVQLALLSALEVPRLKNLAGGLLIPLLLHGGAQEFCQLLTSNVLAA